MLTGPDRRWYRHQVVQCRRFDTMIHHSHTNSVVAGNQCVDEAHSVGTAVTVTLHHHPPSIRENVGMITFYMSCLIYSVADS